MRSDRESKASEVKGHSCHTHASAHSHTPRNATPTVTQRVEINYKSLYLVGLLEMSGSCAVTRSDDFVILSDRRQEMKLLLGLTFLTECDYENHSH